MTDTPQDAQTQTQAQTPPPPATRTEAMGFAFALGMALWALIGAFTNHAEAWDSSWYYYLGIPLMMLAAGLLGHTFPRKAYRHGLWISLGQFAAMVAIGLIHGEGWGLWPLSIVMAYVLSLPLQLAAIAGARLAKRKKAA